MTRRLRVASVLGTMLLVGGPVALSGIASAATNQNPVYLPTRAHFLSPQVIQQSRSLGNVPFQKQWTFSVILPSKNMSGLDAYAQSVSNPHSFNFHHFLTHAELMAQYGPSPNVVNNLTNFLHGQGFVTRVSGQVIQVTGSVTQVNRLFSTNLTQYQYKNLTFVAPQNGVVTIPPSLRIGYSLTGLTTNTLKPLSSILPATSNVFIKHQPNTTTAPTGTTNTVTSGPMTVTAKLLTSGNQAPGLAVHYLITATYKGQPDPSAVLTGLGGPIQGASSAVPDTTVTNSQGQFVLSYTLSQSQSVSLAATVKDQYGYSAQIQLPVSTFSGSSVSVSPSGYFFPGTSQPIVTPLNPGNLSPNTLYHANQLIQQAERKGPAQIAVFTAGTQTAISTSDVHQFAQKFYLNPPKVSLAYSGPNAYTQSYFPIQAELSLDLQMMETSSPGANIQIYAAGSLRSALNQVVSQNTANVFSLSYGAGELAVQYYEPNAQSSWDMLAAEANSEGITVSVSAGDGGAYEGAQFGFTQPQPSYPANSAYVSSVGGTENAVNNSSQILKSALWGGNLGSDIPSTTLLSFLEMENMMGGGGFSSLVAEPGYQAMVDPGTPGRGNPDFSFAASVLTPGYFAYFNGVPYYFGGTSASAPLFAGWTADLAQVLGRQGNINWTIYPASIVRPNIVMPVQFGNNGMYSVTPGYNAATGLGQLNIDQLFQYMDPTLGQQPPNSGAF